MAKKNSKKTVPDLRFRGFTDPWEQRQLGEVAQRVTRRNLNNECSRVLTASAEAGLIDQQEYFQKRIASHDLSHYYLLKRGDFAYNHSSSGSAALGIIKRLEAYDFGCLSTLYIIFHPKHGIDSDYLLHYFESSAWHGDVAGMVTEGARNHGLLNISPDTFFTARCSFPSLPEQRRIGKFFTIFDSLIAAAERQEALLRQKKQAYLQLMFPQEGETEPRLRFAGFSGEWSRRQLGELITEHKETVDSHCTLPILTSSKTEGITLQEEHFGHKQSHDIAGYNVVPRGYCTYRNRSDDMDFTFNVNNYCDKGIISKFYPVFRGNGNDTLFISLVLNHCEEVLREIEYTCTGTGQRVLAFSDLQMMRIPIPTHAEQQKVAKFFEIFDSLIVATEQRTESLRALKSAYLQRMFV